MHISALKTSKFIGKEDVDPQRGTVLTITRLKKENVAREDEERDEKWILYFKEIEKGLVLNSTNVQLAALALRSEETDEWVGKRIKLYVDPTVSFGGKLVGGIRVFVPKPGSAPAPAKAEPFPDEIPPDPFNDELPPF